jgi:hypothetical protein
LETIHKYKIRTVVVHLVDGCHVEIATQRSSPLRKNKYQRLITFGAGYDFADGSVPIKHYLTKNGTLLSIDTFYDESGEIQNQIPYQFKIILPEGCHITFKYSRAPLSWKLEVYE